MYCFVRLADTDCETVVSRNRNVSTRPIFHVFYARRRAPSCRGMISVVFDTVTASSGLGAPSDSMCIAQGQAQVTRAAMTSRM